MCKVFGLGLDLFVTADHVKSISCTVYATYGEYIKSL